MAKRTLSQEEKVKTKMFFLPAMLRLELREMRYFPSPRHMSGTLVGNLSFFSTYFLRGIIRSAVPHMFAA